MLLAEVLLNYPAPCLLAVVALVLLARIAYGNPET
jgi:hypothetical protein